MAKQFSHTRGVEFAQLEEEVLKWWGENQIFERCIAHRRDAPIFTFFEGPPTANGRPGIHHVLGRTIKDTFCRYKTLKGFKVKRKAGWDTHGLPVEIEVEKELGLEGREQIEEFGIARFNRACKDSVVRYKKEWDDLTRRIGYWVDLDQPYITYETNYIESVWWLIKEIHQRDLLYRGHKIQWYSPGSGTVLSSHEVSLGYQEITDPSVYVRFRTTAEDRCSLLAWTTTPWTLISNVALAVGPNIDYVKIAIADGDNSPEKLILAEARLDVIKVEYEIIERLKGSDLVGLDYVPLYTLPDIGDHPQAWRVVAAEYVSTEEGTGIVHQAPAFGAEDYEVALREGLPVFNPMGADGRFIDHTPLVAGVWFIDANKIINRDLRERGLLYRLESYRHNYPHDWRKGTPLMNYPVDSWFIRTTALKDRLVDLNRTINWYPPSIRDGRFGNWLENNVDWALSRKRYWGTPLPIWTSDKDGSDYFEVIGSIAELRAKCSQELPSGEDLDLHRPYVDDLTWPAPDGGTMRRVPDVIDVWFDSGAMPFAQWHYPFENKDEFERHYPADFICEGLDQTRGWFYTLHAISVLVRDSIAFKNCVVNGLLLDEKGEKMSKSKGNTLDPFETVAAYGADVVRWYMMSNSPPWDSMKFARRGLTDTRNKFFSTLENVYRFMASYANIDGFNYSEAPIPSDHRTELDRWILSRLNSTIKTVDDAFANYDATRAARAIENFVEEFSNWYIRRSRPRFWAAKKGGEGAHQISNRDKLSAYQTTYECLVAVAKLMSPIAPFFSEWLYRNLNGVARLESKISVHLCDFPIPADDLIQPSLEHRMGLARSIVALVLLLRNKNHLNVRQPLSRILLVVGSEVEQATVDSVRDIILDEINVKRIEYIEDSNAVVKRSAKADFKRLGPRLQQKMKSAAMQIAQFDDAQITELLTNGTLAIDIDGELVRLERADVEIHSEELGDWSVAQEGGITVALDTQLTPDLLAQGFAREVVNRTQTMRKSADFVLTDRIRVEYCASGALQGAIETHTTFICQETLALELIYRQRPCGTLVEAFRIGDHDLSLAITVVPSA
ncbi:MAG: isoleucine--tRNA ligase [Proteobacteria bacterium]|nr:MAG: isoleucine--tRNA ligase [Pseudomonadota bacterium]